MTISNVKSTSLYYPQEQIILSHWLGRKQPKCVPYIFDLEYDQEDIDGVGLHSSSSSIDDEDLAISNAVARILLSAIEERLPHWEAVKQDGTVIHGRKQVAYPPHRHRQISTIPRKLFTINWATSGPGYSWPEAYYVTWIPIYDVWVVTLSQDSVDTYGYADLAMGWFDKDTDLIEGARAIITSEWGSQRAEYDQQPWECLFGTGLVDESTAYEWAQSVWGEQSEGAYSGEEKQS